MLFLYTAIVFDVFSAAFEASCHCPRFFSLLSSLFSLPLSLLSFLFSLLSFLFSLIPIRIRPKSGPEARFMARKHYCVTSGKYLEHPIMGNPVDNGLWGRISPLSNGETIYLTDFCGPTVRYQRRFPVIGCSGYYSMSRNSASGLEVRLSGRILVGLLPPKYRNGPSGRPKAGRRADFGAFPLAVRPKSDPEG
jgi:hypothetical protein